jgi:hypothetical protein
LLYIAQSYTIVNYLTIPSESLTIHKIPVSWETTRDLGYNDRSISNGRQYKKRSGTVYYTYDECQRGKSPMELLLGRPGSSRRHGLAPNCLKFRVLGTEQYRTPGNAVSRETAPSSQTSPSELDQDRHRRVRGSNTPGHYPIYRYL